MKADERFEIQRFDHDELPGRVATEETAQRKPERARQRSELHAFAQGFPGQLLCLAIASDHDRKVLRQDLDERNCDFDFAKPKGMYPYRAALLASGINAPQAAPLSPSLPALTQDDERLDEECEEDRSCAVNPEPAPKTYGKLQSGAAHRKLVGLACTLRSLNRHSDLA